MQTVTVGIVTAFIQYAQRFFRPIQDLSEKYNILQSAMASSERVFKLLDSPVEIVSPANPVKAEGKGRIEFDHVWFAYRKLDPAEAKEAVIPASTNGHVPDMVEAREVIHDGSGYDGFCATCLSPSNRVRAWLLSDTQGRERPPSSRC